jgi:hypothetical protein
VDIFSLSFGDCEANMGSNNAQINSLWEQAATQGITVTVSTGDSGSAGCDYNVTQASGGLQVSGFASTPYNIAVGGTDFYALNSSFTNYVSTTDLGTSANNYDYYRTVLANGPHTGYIPESTWNDSTTIDTTISANVASTNTCATGKTTTNILAGSGGASSCATGSGATCAGYPKPSWQTGTDGHRDIPDVSLMAGNGCDPATWLICSTDTTTYQGQTVTQNCTTQSDGYFFFVGYGGTSTSAPAFAGILALVEQKSGGRLGQAAKELQQLYTLANGAHASSVFHDVTVGNISVPCKSGSSNCGPNGSGGAYFESGYNTGVGYDLATGLGSVDATQLVNNWSSSSGSAAATIGITPSLNPVTTVQSLSVVISVSGSSGTPTGTVTLTSGSYSSGAQTIGLSGSCTAASCAIAVPAGSLAIGTDTLTVTYSGDLNYAATNKTATEQVTGLALTVTGTVTGTGGTPTGTVTLTGGGYTSPATALSSGSYSITIPANSLNTGSDTLTVTYNGNSIYDAGAVKTTQVTVTYFAVLTPAVTVIPATSTLDSSQTLNVTVTVAGAGATPTGTVTLTSGSYTSGPQTLAGSGTCTAALCTIIIPANSLNSSLGGSSDTLTATYGGDSNYTSGSGTASVTVTSSVFSVSATTPAAAIAPGASTTSTVTVSSSLYYSGTVTLSCALTSYPSGAVYLPSCSFTSGSPVTLSGTTTSGTATATVSTTAPTSSELVYPRLPGKGRGLFGAGGGAVLAFLVFLGIPARRRSWRSMLGVLVVMAALGSLAGCGGVSGGGGGGGSTPGTTAGTYTSRRFRKTTFSSRRQCSVSAISSHSTCGEK